MNMGKYTCQRPVHPGELLKEEIESRGLPQTRLAAQTGISYKILNDILNCRRPLTTSTAMLFEAALGIRCGCNLTTTCSRPLATRLSWNGLPK